MTRTQRILLLLCWTFGAIFVFAGAFSAHNPGFQAPGDPWRPIIMATGFILILVAAITGRKETISDPGFSSTSAAILLTVVVLIAVPMKLYHLDTVPYGAHNDEIVKGMQVIKFFNGGSFQPFYVANKEFLFFYMLIPFIKFFGVTIIGLRMLPFCCGLITIVFSYLLFRKLWGQSIAMCGIAFLAVGLWPNQSAHICERLNSAPMFTAAALFFTLAAVTTRQFWYFILAGAISAAGMWSFPTFRLIPWACIAITVIGFCHGKLSVRKDSWKAVLLVLSCLILTTAPLNFSPTSTYKTFYSRRGHDFKIAKNSDQIKENTEKLLKSFTVDCVEDMSFTLRDAPLVWWPLGLLLIIGLISVLSKPTHFETHFMIVWLGAALLPAVASEPTVRRLTAVQPALFGLIGLGGWITISGIAPYLNKKRSWGLIPVFTLVALAGYRNFTVFTTEIAPKWRVAWEDYWIVEAAIENFDRLEVHVDWLEEEAELPLRYLFYPKTGTLKWYQPERPQYSIPFKFSPKRDFIYLFRNIPENQFAVKLLPDLYPEGVLILHQNPEHPRGYYSFTMKKEDLQRRRGVAVSESNGSVIHEIQFQIPISLRDSMGEMILESAVLADSHGQYQLLVQGPLSHQLRINNQLQQPVTSSDKQAEYAVFMTKGPQTIQIRLPEQSNTGKLKILWRTPTRKGRPKPEADWVELPAHSLLRTPLPATLTRPSPQQVANYQFTLKDSIRHPHPDGGRSYDISRVEKVDPGKFLANCWHYQTMVELDRNASIQSSWHANLLEDPQWARRFDFDVDDQGNVYIVGDSRKYLLIATDSGQLIRKVELPAVPLAIELINHKEGLFLFHHRVAIVSLEDGEVISEIGSWGNATDQYYWPLAIAVDELDQCYVADRAFNRIQVYTRHGKFLKSIAIPGPLGDTMGLNFDEEGNLLVPHFTSDRVFIVSRSGELLTGAPDYGSDALNSAGTHRPRYTFYPDPDTLWITNSDLIYQFTRASSQVNR